MQKQAYSGTSQQKGQTLWESIFIESQETKVFLSAMYASHPCAWVHQA